MTDLHKKKCPECGSKLTALGNVTSFCARGHEHPTSEFRDPESEYFALFSDGKRVKLIGEKIEMAKERIKISECSGMEFEDWMLSAYIMGMHDALNYDKDTIMIGVQKSEKQTT